MERVTMRDDPKQVKAPCCPAGKSRKVAEDKPPAKRAKFADAKPTKDGDAT